MNERCSRCGKTDQEIALYLGEKRKPICKKCWPILSKSDEELG